MEIKIQKSYKKKYQEHIVFSYEYKLVCVDDKISKPFKTYFGKDAVKILLII